MRILMTGGSGYIGSYLARELAAVDDQVYVVDPTPPFAELLATKRVVWMAHDLFHPVAADIMMRFDAIVHLAAIVGEDACKAEPMLAQHLNVDGTRTALAIPHDRFVLFSTCSNYGINGDLADESAPLKPLSLYAETKIEAERLVTNAGGLVFRFATVCGVSPRTRHDLLVNEMARACKRGRPFEIRDPDAWRPFVHIADVARAVRLALALPPERCRGIYNIVGANLQKRDLVDMALANFPSADIRVRNGARDRRDYRVSGTRASHDLGFLPIHMIANAFADVADQS